jgi:hypothetical protein
MRVSARIRSGVLWFFHLLFAIITVLLVGSAVAMAMWVLNHNQSEVRVRLLTRLLCPYPSRVSHFCISLALHPLVRLSLISAARQCPKLYLWQAVHAATTAVTVLGSWVASARHPCGRQYLHTIRTEPAACLTWCSEVARAVLNAFSFGWFIAGCVWVFYPGWYSSVDIQNIGFGKL